LAARQAIDFVGAAVPGSCAETFDRLEEFREDSNQGFYRSPLIKDMAFE
jgi:hypothetical protein